MKGSATDLHIKNVGDVLRLHLQQLLPLPLDQITTELVEDARTAYLGTVGVGSRPGHKGTWDLPHTKAGANKVVQNLGSVLGWAVRRGIIEAMPYKLPRLKPKEDIKAVLWPEQVVQFVHVAGRGRRALHHAFPHSLTTMLFMLELGLRENEALDARWERLDLRRKVYMCPGKNQGVREIPVPDYLLDHLARVLGPTTAMPRGLILSAEDGQGHAGQFTLHPVARCGLALGIVGLTPHRLRASFATCHFEDGTPLSQIQQMMGHEDPETTMGYIIQRPRDQAEAQERVARRQGLIPPGFPNPDSIMTTPEQATEKSK
jgi:integrase